MSKIKKGLTVSASKQGRWFEVGLKEGSLNISGTFRDVLSEAIRECKTQSRYQIAAHTSELVGRSITKDMLDKYTSACPDCGFRAEDLPAFCHATGSIKPLQCLVETVGWDLVSPEDAKMVRLAKLESAKRDLEVQIAALKSGK